MRIEKLLTIKLKNFIIMLRLPTTVSIPFYIYIKQRAR